MGYNTSYSLDLIHGDICDVLEEVFAAESDELSELEYVFDECGRGDEPRRWYTHDQDMRRLSLLYPDKVFLLSGAGEEEGDLWKKYYLNGKVQHCPAKISYDGFDPNKLI